MYENIVPVETQAYEEWEDAHISGKPKKFLKRFYPDFGIPISKKNIQS